MRDFFRTELKRLHLTTGLQQGYKLPDAEVTELLDILCAECDKFPLIPDPEKQRAISEFMTSDPEFIGFNKRTIWRWLNVVNKRYVTTQADFQEAPDVELTPEQSEKIDRMLEDWKKQLAGFVQKPEFVGLENDIEAIKREDAEQRAGKKATVKKGWTQHDETKRERHNRWIRENFDINGKKLETWLPEYVWESRLTESDLTPQATPPQPTTNAD